MACWRNVRVYCIVDCSADAARLRAPHAELAIQVRDKAAPGAVLYAAVRAWVERGYRVYVNDRVDVALAAGAEGVQLPGGGLTPAQARTLGALRVGVSIHSPAEAREDADFCVLSPIFASPGKGLPLGSAALREATRSGVPVLALGGVDARNAAECFAAGAAGVAAIRAGAELAGALL